MSYLTPATLMRRAHGELDAAHGHSSPRERFLGAHMAALRAAGAVLALGVRPQSKRGKLRSAWIQLAEVSPHWQPWVEFYMDSARLRAELEAGMRTEITATQARRSLEIAGRFLTEVEEFIEQHHGASLGLAQAS